MSEKKSLNQIAWEEIFKTHDVLNKISTDGEFIINASEIKRFREPRLMSKFDNEINLPKIFKDHKLAILPISRSSYIISHFEAYHKFEAPDDSNIATINFPIPDHIQSLDFANITSEAIALNCALAAGIITDFVGDMPLIPTVSGRMSSKSFDFNINNTYKNTPHSVSVNNSQIEIDAAYECPHCLAIFEAKRDISTDLLIRQLYYPYRLWKNTISKPVKPFFLTYSNGIFRLYEFAFEDINNYNSLILIKQKKYSVENTIIELNDIEDVLRRTALVKEQSIPFPQANSFERVINLCELLNDKELNHDDITVEYAFDSRQTDYYTNAAKYLGLLERVNDTPETPYNLTDLGKRILSLSYKQRQLAFCSQILSHKAFNEVLKLHLEISRMPSTAMIVKIMKKANLHNIHSDNTYERRSSTIKSWVNWILSLIS
ncbi:MAG: hypothetical protein Q4G54_07615 [Pelistega sp.]|nr:hypothetical protein [Pelistega sp.]